MIGWLKRLIAGAPTVRPPVPVLTDALDAEPVIVSSGAVPAPLHAALIDRHFYALLADGAQGEGSAALERAILDEMARLVQHPYSAAGLVPRVPAVIPQLLASLRDDTLSGADLARQVAQDVVLVAEVIREANSPYYRPATPVKTIESAVMLLGLNGLRMLLARVAFRPVIGIQSGRFARQVAPLVWTQSEQCALAASILAGGLDANAFDAYLAGLMHNIGLIVAFRVIDRIMPAGGRALSAATLPDSPAFCASLLEQARALSSTIAAEWNFPAPVVSAIATPRATPLGLALALGDRMAKLRMLVDGGVFAREAALAGLDTSLWRCFDQLQPRDA
ncbi:HDOD domain-containing protein [Massilia sp. S19_KUP03_FR1]|uniref:HDOD domain-containing protein n=1 Tax=Massilia sp. S19_KUP03_FR1 TaxID=3025503 RepID=UPI002FCD9D7F